MKQIIIKGFAALLLGLCFVFQAVDAQAVPIDPTVSLNVLDTDILVGETFYVEVLANNVDSGDPLSGFGFNVVTDDFTYIGATVNSFYFSTIPAAGTDVAGGGASIFGDGILLATLEFIAPSTEGNYSLGISSNYQDTSIYQGLFTAGNRYNMTTSVDLDVSSSASAVPEPGTLLLLGSGVLGVAAFGRKFRVRG